MTLRIKLSHLVVGLVVGALLVGGGYALASTRNAVIHACINLKTRALTVPASGRCSHGLRRLSWNRQGVRGVAGAKGATGSAGTPASVSIGSVTTLAAGSPATVTNSGTSSNAVLNFGIPQGAAGANAVGTGATAYGQVWMGSSAAQLAPGSFQNATGVTGGNGTATVRVANCSAATPTEPVITITPDSDPADNLTGANDTTNVAGAYLTSYSDGNAPGAHVVSFTVETYNPILTNNSGVNSDFAFSVIC